VTSAVAINRLLTHASADRHMQFRPSEPNGDHKCPHCGALHRIVSWGHTPARDSDHEICHVCEKEMARWNATSYPVFELIKADDGGVDVGN
jgi:hypothetical protein